MDRAAKAGLVRIHGTHRGVLLVEFPGRSLGLSNRRRAPVGFVERTSRCDDGRPPLRGRCWGGWQGRSPAAAVAGPSPASMGLG
jgi:hypothetical protein